MRLTADKALILMCYSQLIMHSNNYYSLKVDINILFRLNNYNITTNIVFMLMIARGNPMTCTQRHLRKSISCLVWSYW